MTDQPPHGPGIMRHLHPQDAGHPGAQQYDAEHCKQRECAAVIPHPAGAGAGKYIDETAGGAGAFRKQELPVVLQAAGRVSTLYVGQGETHQGSVRRTPDHTLHVGQEYLVRITQGAQGTLQQGMQFIFLHR